MASRKLAVASLPALLLIVGALLLVAARPASSGAAVNEEDAASGQFPSSVDRAPEPSPRNSRAVRAGSPVVSSLVGALPSAPASAPKGSAAVPQQAPAPQPHPPCDSKDAEKLWLLVLIFLILYCLSN
ncbi:unnamed protein product [Urochloa humidicola]